MYFKFFAIPKAVYFYCILPALIIIIASLIFRIVYSRKKETYYYVFNTNYFLLLTGVVISALLIALLLGYSAATIYMIFISGTFAEFYILVIFLIILPIIPICLFIWLCFKIHENFKYKEELDDNLNKNLDNKELDNKEDDTEKEIA